MEVSKIIAEIDAQIVKLQQARVLLSGAGTEPSVRRPGRPKGSKNTATSTPAAPKKTTSRKLSPEGRKRIAEAMKRRWAERKKASAKTPAVAK